MPKKVVVAMSGGVDSSVAAALLKKQGFQVMGVFMKFTASASVAENRAKNVAKVLKIPFRVLDFRKEFKKKVIDCFLEEYQTGRTPNPCVVCNKEIKFGLLLEKALALGADYIATGHYAKKIQNPKSKIQKLLRAKDKNKDQSYFLWKLNQKQLKHVLFPVGGYTKPEVRQLAKKFKLPVAETPESQEICFVPGEINDFLAEYIKSKKGKIVDVSGKILCEHQGLIFYTIGQRKGIGLAGGPYWVAGKDFKRNFLIVTKNEKDLLRKELLFKNESWISGKPPKLPAKLKAKIRSRHEAALGILKNGNRFIFNRAQRAITPGQSVVLYKDDELLGGGIIS